jgi:DNA-binding NarL/FixJ family response regulator
VPRVLIVAGSAFERAGLEALLSPDVDVSAAAPAEAAEAIEREQPDVILMALDGDDDLPADVAGDAAHPALVVLADDPDLSWTTEALRAGARAVLPRDAAAEEIVAAVRAAAAGLIVLHADVVGSLLPAPRPEAPRDRAGQALTPREVEVLRMLAEGLGNKEIAARLGISDHTVKFHVTSIFTKLNASSRTEAVTLGVRRGLIML